MSPLEFFAEYGLFLAKSLTILITLVVGVAAIVAVSAKGQMPGQKGQMEVKKINDLYNEYQAVIEDQTFTDEEKKAHKKAKKASDKKQKDDKSSSKPKVFVISFDGDVKASAVDNLRQEVNAILLTASDKDEVVIDLESPGGMVHTYGLAASQLSRIKQANIPLTICVDRVAASGGYLMACVGNKILAAPFAIIGSIGVLAQIPNFNRALKKVDVDYEVMTAGEYKAPISMFGEITEKGKAKLQSELEETHHLFKQFIADNRPIVDLDKVATGEVWYGQQAIDKALVDEISTLDDYLLSKRDSNDLYQIKYVEKKSLPEKLGFLAGSTAESAINHLLQRDRKALIERDLS